MDSLCVGTLTVYLILIKAAAGTSQELRQGFEPPLNTNHAAGGALHTTRGQRDEVYDSVLGRAKGDEDYVQMQHVEGEEPDRAQCITGSRQSGWERCHQFVPSHGGHAGDGEAMAAPCPHHG
ncbi:hypothetical protein CesoFtcFv8_002114 [Champsocephalus esox]|uniref:Secreted protein n=1 Tax=Champsocephalus esox TaxID=159716 RepID=A0AAN8HEC9_9TELE|nr:hypothetical protein CesoFtcFv8_002114 [Champsocephalus esox]